MKELQHHHILPILGMSQHQQEGDNIARDSLFIIVDKLESTLDSKLDEWAKTLGYFRKITSKEPVMIRINEVALAIGQALQYIHSQHYAFRDLKPSNIGFDQSGSVKIFDFGLAVRIPTSGKGVKGKVGTLRYMAPETRRGKRYSYPVDVYAYAILLWQIITARVPFEEDIPMSTIVSTKDMSYDKRPDLKYIESKKLSELLKSSWKTNPEERLTLDELMPELQQIGIQMRLSCTDSKKKKKPLIRNEKPSLDKLIPERKKKLSFGNKILPLDKLKLGRKKMLPSLESKILSIQRTDSTYVMPPSLDSKILSLQRTDSTCECSIRSPCSKISNVPSSVNSTVSILNNYFEKNVNVTSRHPHSQSE